jgi:hypothetical protein
MSEPKLCPFRGEYMQRKTELGTVFYRADNLSCLEDKCAMWRSWSNTTVSDLGVHDWPSSKGCGLAGKP